MGLHLPSNVNRYDVGKLYLWLELCVKLSNIRTERTVHTVVLRVTETYLYRLFDQSQV